MAARRPWTATRSRGTKTSLWNDGAVSTAGLSGKSPATSRDTWGRLWLDVFWTPVFLTHLSFRRCHRYTGGGEEGTAGPSAAAGPCARGPAPAAGEHGVGTASCRLRLTGQCFPSEQGCERSLGTFTAVKGGWSALAGSEPPTASRSRCDGVSLAPAFKASKQATPG